MLLDLVLIFAVIFTLFYSLGSSLRRFLLVSDGAGLFCGVLKHLLDRGSNCPKVLAATHFHEVFRANLFDCESVPVTFLHMQVMFTAINGDISTDNDASAIRNRIEHQSHKSQDWEENSQAKVVGPGEKMTYLYK